MKNLTARAMVLSAFLLPLGAASADSPLTEGRTALEQWVRTRQLISKARSDWQSDQDLIQQTIRLYERELGTVADQMSKVSTNSTQVDKERLEAEGLKETSRATLERAKEFAARFEVALNALGPKLPVPLQDILKPHFSRMPTDPNTRMTAAERMQVIVGILNEVDKFNNAISVFSEKRKNEKGEEMAVETLYVGLGAAYFVNDAGDFSGAGTPGPQGWEWTTRPELASSIREVLRVYRNERPPRFVALPAEIR